MYYKKIGVPKYEPASGNPTFEAPDIPPSRSVLDRDLREPLYTNQVVKVIKRFQALDTHFTVIKLFRERKTIRVKEESQK